MRRRRDRRGTSHEGIIVLPADVKAGTPAKEYFQLEDDYLLEIGLTPNRADAMSHYGVARDLAVYLKANDIPHELILPAVDAVRPGQRFENHRRGGSRFRSRAALHGRNDDRNQNRAFAGLVATTPASYRH